MTHAVQIAPFILIRTGERWVWMCLPHFKVASHLDAEECVLSLLLTPNPPLPICHTETHTQTHEYTCSGGLRVEERLPWVTQRDRVLSRRAILIYVNKPRCCRERQRGHRWALVTSAPSLEGKAQTKSNGDSHAHTHWKKKKKRGRGGYIEL